MQGHGDPDTLSTAFFGAIGAVVVVLLILLVQVYFYAYEHRELEQRVVQPAYQELMLLRARQQQQIHSYRLVDAQAGVVAIPIERAMERLAAEAQDNSAGETGE
ncbi:MAG: hypothetical protein JSV80_13395 [Acidobacteriota bacterium]|nr:MAG: hypothetical protein JSV80_13395 [Acidobacteriota bacterium]